MMSLHVDATAHLAICFRPTVLAMTVRLEWDGKSEHLERLRLPFQTVETINESRATRERDSGALFGLS